MIDQPLGMTYNCAVRAEHVDFELLQLMKASRLLDDQSGHRDRR